MSNLRDTVIPVDWSHTLQQDPKVAKGNSLWQHLNTVRIYPYSPGICCLQIRTEGRTSRHGKTSYQAHSSAGLGLLQAMQLKDALDSWIAEWSKEQRDEAYEMMVRIEETEVRS